VITGSLSGGGLKRAHSVFTRAIPVAVEFFVLHFTCDVLRFEKTVELLLARMVNFLAIKLFGKLCAVLSAVLVLNGSVLEAIVVSVNYAILVEVPWGFGVIKALTYTLPVHGVAPVLRERGLGVEFSHVVSSYDASRAPVSPVASVMISFLEVFGEWGS